MHILFVSSGTNKSSINSIVTSQGESLVEKGICLEYFTIKQKGLKGYIRAILLLKKRLRSNHYDIIHAHYSISGWVALLAKKKEKLVLSLMGDDAYGTYNEKGRLELKSIWLIVLSKFIQPFCNHIIVKSQNIYNTVIFRNKASIIPNGVNIDLCTNLNQNEIQIFLNEKKQKKYILFLGDTNEPRKNFTLLQTAINQIQNKNIEIIAPFPIPHNDVIKYLNTTDVIVLCSTIEGSPNVIKEAMACNCPIVSTDVGDVRWVIGETEGCYITNFDSNDVAEKIKLALQFSKTKGRTNGRQRIIELGLDNDTIATKIISVYEKVLFRGKKLSII